VMFMVAPMKAYVANTRRTQLVDSATVMLQRMTLDLHQALPNSIRVKSSGTLQVVEFVHVTEVVAYRTGPVGINAAINLDFTQPDTQFDSLGTLNYVPMGVLPSKYQLVIYNLGLYGANTDSPMAGQNVYGAVSSGPSPPSGSNVVTPVGTSITTVANGTETQFNLNPAFQFSMQSPKQLMYIIDTPVSYICDTSTGHITRYDTYALSSIQPITASSSPLSTANSALAAQNVSTCQFTYTVGTSQQNAVLSVNLIMTEQGSNTRDTIRLFEQIHVINTP